VPFFTSIELLNNRRKLVQLGFGFKMKIARRLSRRHKREKVRDTESSLS
jgi:uncharacterized UPF0146 family protein